MILFIIMETYKNYRLWKILGFLGTTAILVASLWPQEAGKPIPYLDKVLHLGVYAIASFYIQQLYKNQKLIQIIFFFFLYGAVIEILQHLGGNRQADPFDIVANFIGIVCGSLLSLKSKLLLKVDKLI